MQKQMSEFLTTRFGVLKMCVMQWLIAKINKNNKLMLRAEDVLILIKLETKSC